jgi:hypothetical protein
MQSATAACTLASVARLQRVNNRLIANLIFDASEILAIGLQCPVGSYLKALFGPDCRSRLQ